MNLEKRLGVNNDVGQWPYYLSMIIRWFGSTQPFGFWIYFS